MNIKPESKVKVFGTVMSFEQYVEKYADGDQKKGNDVLEILIKKGKAIMVDERSKQDKVFDLIAKEEAIVTLANISEQQEHNRKVHHAEKKREGKLAYDEIQIEYADFIQATQAEQYYIDELYLKDTEVTRRNGQVYLVIRNLTERELNFINTTYKRDKIISGTMNFTEKGVDNLVGAVDYTAKNVLGPAVKIGTKGTVSIIKTLTGVFARTGATVITSTTQGVKDTAKYLRDDEEILRAGKDLINTKDAIVRTANKQFNGGSTSGGITIVNR